MKNKTLIHSAGPSATASASGEAKKPSAKRKKAALGQRLLIKGLRTLQHISPKLTSSIIWDKFTQTPKPRFTEQQSTLICDATVSEFHYKGFALKAYRWQPTGENNGKKILLSHGWGSKVADFRRMIQWLVQQGYTVEGVDMKGHGNSPGTHTALPEIRDVLKNYYTKNGPFQAVVGYSIGGLAAGLAMNEISAHFHPKQLVIIATPPYTRYFFRDIISQVGCTEKVYNEMCEMVEKNYQESIDYFDLRSKVGNLGHLDLHMIYDEHDKTVPFEKGMELGRLLPLSSFVHVTGTSHEKIIADEKVIEYIGSVVGSVSIAEISTPA